MPPMLLANTLSHYSPYLFPNKFDQGQNDTSPLLPKDHAHILSLPFLNTNKVLRVYFNSLAPAKDYLSSENASYYNAYLFVYNPQGNTSTYLGVMNPESQTGNSGALYIPYALRGDNKAITLDAWMGDPGAGGGSTDYGYALMPILLASKSTVINHSIVRGIATRNAVFYDHFNKVIYIDEGGKTAACAKPGPTNDAVIFYRNLLHPTKKRILAEQPNTTYSHINVDEVNKTVSFIATRYLNLPPDECPQEVYPQSTLKRKSMTQVMRLP